jgi:glycosyltransferase involved in cell wall biosynthesis
MSHQPGCDSPASPVTTAPDIFFSPPPNRSRGGTSAVRTPRVSVCVPTCNRSGSLQTSLETILNQTFEDFELVVIDNCSDDETEQVARSVIDSRLRYVRNGVRLSKMENINRCVGEARFDLIAIYHDDDLFHPDLLRRSVEILDAHPRVGMVCAAIHAVDALDPRRILATYIESWQTVSPGHEIARDLTRRWDCPVNTPTALVRRSVYEDVGLWRPDFGDPSDREFWLRALNRWDLGYISEPMALLRDWRNQRRMSAEVFWHSLRMHVQVQRMNIDVFFGASRTRALRERQRLRRQRFGRFWQAALWAIANERPDVVRAGVLAFQEEGLSMSAKVLQRIHDSERTGRMIRRGAALRRRAWRAEASSAATVEGLA